MTNDEKIIFEESLRISKEKVNASYVVAESILQSTISRTDEGLREWVAARYNFPSIKNEIDRIQSIRKPYDENGETEEDREQEEVPLINAESEDIKWRFEVVGNIIGNHLDDQGIPRLGTKEFSAGTKVWIDGRNNNPSCTAVTCIGRGRYKRLEMVSVPIQYIENVRTQRVFNPAVLEMMEKTKEMDGWCWWGILEKDKTAAEEFVNRWNNQNA